MKILTTGRIQTSVKKGEKILRMIRNKTIEQIFYTLKNSPQKVSRILYKQFYSWKKEFSIIKVKEAYSNMLKPIKRLEIMSRGRSGLKCRPYTKFIFKYE